GENCRFGPNRTEAAEIPEQNGTEIEQDGTGTETETGQDKTERNRTGQDGTGRNAKKREETRIPRKKASWIWNDAACTLSLLFQSDRIMDIFRSIAAFLLLLLGIVGCVAPLLPGPALSFAGLLCAYGCSYSSMSGTAVVLWLAATIV